MPVNQLNQAQVDALKTTLIARFNAGLKLSPEDWKRVAKLVKSSSKSNTYAWLSDFPAFREWVGSRLHKKYKETAFVVQNRKFEATVDVQVDDLDDDEIGQYGTQAEGAGQAETDLKNDLIYQTINEGFSRVCYDGQFFFDTDHPVYANEDGTGAVTMISNMQAGDGPMWALLCTKRAPAPVYLQERARTGLVMNTGKQFDDDVISFGAKWRGEGLPGFWQCAFGSKDVLNAANFEAAYDSMMNVKGDGLRKIGVIADTIVVGPSNRAAAEAILNKDKLAGGESNINYKRVELIVTPWLP